MSWPYQIDICFVNLVLTIDLIDLCYKNIFVANFQTYIDVCFLIIFFKPIVFGLSEFILSNIAFSLFWLHKLLFRKISEQYFCIHCFWIKWDGRMKIDFLFCLVFVNIWLNYRFNLPVLYKPFWRKFAELHIWFMGNILCN